MVNKAKAYLKQIPDLQCAIRAKQELYNSFQSMAENTSQRHGEIKVKSSTNLHKQEDLILKMVAVGQELDEALNLLIDLQREAIDMISKLEDPKHQAVLIQRYVNGKSWPKVACDIYNTNLDDPGLDGMIRNTHYIHGRALEKFSLFFMVTL